MTYKSLGINSNFLSLSTGTHSQLETKRKIYDNARSAHLNSKYDTTKSSSYYRSRFPGTPSYRSRNTSTDNSKSNNSHSSIFRGLFEKTFNRFFGSCLFNLIVFVLCLFANCVCYKIELKKNRNLFLKNHFEVHG